VNVSLRMLLLWIDCDTTVKNVFAYGPDGKVFFCPLNYPGSWGDSSLTAQFLPHIKKKNGNFKICFQGGVQLTIFWLDHLMIALHEDFIPVYVIICCMSVMCTRQVSGVCMECMVLFLVARNAYQVIVSKEDLSWNQ
jgi:hypothetical protein